MASVSEKRAAVARVARSVLDDPLWKDLMRENPSAAVGEIREWISRKCRVQEKLRLFSDGGSHGNPGPSGAGGIILDEEGNEAARYSVYLGIGTNNVAEYKALIEGIIRLDRLEPEEVEIFLDSELLVKQLLGSYKVKSAHLAPLYRNALEKLGRFPKWSVRHIPREENSAADRLAQAAITAETKKRKER